MMRKGNAIRLNNQRAIYWGLAKDGLAIVYVDGKVRRVKPERLVRFKRRRIQQIEKRALRKLRTALTTMENK